MSKKYIVCLLIILGILALFLIYKAFSPPRSAKSFGPFTLGDEAPVTGSIPTYKDLYDLDYDFYIYAMERDMSYCAQSDCGMIGALVECMEGWLSGEGLVGDGGAEDWGLSVKEVGAGESSLIIIADRDKKIVGLYPNYRVRNVPYILKNYRDHIEQLRFDECYNQMPTRF